MASWTLGVWRMDDTQITDQAKVFDGRNVPKQVDGESADAYKVRCLDFWRDFPKIAPEWVRNELVDTSESRFDTTLIGEQAAAEAACFSNLTGLIVNDVAQLVNEIVAGRRGWDSLPDGWDKILLKSALEHQSKMQIERLKTRGTMRVERQRFGNELEIIKLAQGTINTSGTLTLELTPFSSKAARTAAKLIGASNDKGSGKQDHNDPDSMLDGIAAPPTKEPEPPETE